MSLLLVDCPIWIIENFKLTEDSPFIKLSNEKKGNSTNKGKEEK